MKSHIHELERVYVTKRGEKKIPYKDRKLRDYTWVCRAPNCYARFYYDTVKNKQSICTSCHIRELTLDKRNVTLAKPKCIYCSTSSRSIEARAVADAGASLIQELTNAFTPEPLMPTDAEFQQDGKDLI